MARRTEFLERLEDTVIEKLESADLNAAGSFILEEGLYLALMADLFLVSGRFKVYTGDGTDSNPKTILALERQVLADMISNMRSISSFELPFPVGVSPLGITFTNVRPLGWATALLQSWESALGAAEKDDNDVVYYIALPKHVRMFMVLGLPAMLRIAVQLTRQLIQLAKP